MTYKSACLMSWGLVLLAAITIILIISSIDLAHVINVMLNLA